MPIPSQPAAVQAGDPYGSDPYGSSEGIRARPRNAFFLCHDPGDWSIGSHGLDEKTWLPVFAPHIIRPGSAGIRSLTKAEADQGSHARAYEDAKHAREVKGIVYLDAKIPVPPEFHPTIPAEYRQHLSAAPGYAVRYPCTDPRRGRTGFRWVELWDIPQPAVRGKATRFAYDRANFNRWRLWLVQTGIIKPPLAHIIDENLARVAQRVQRATVHPDPHIRVDKVNATSATLKSAKNAKVPALATDEPPRPDPPPVKNPPADKVDDPPADPPAVVAKPKGRTEAQKKASREKADATRARNKAARAAKVAAKAAEATT